MVEGQRKPTGSTAGGAPSPPRLPRRRLIASPANDNATSPGTRALRAAVFVTVGAALAFAMHYFMG